jgi:hypothetical protein
MPTSLIAIVIVTDRVAQIIHIKVRFKFQITSIEPFSKTVNDSSIENYCMYSNFKLLQLSNSGFHEHFSIIEFVSLPCHLVIVALDFKTAASTCASL